MKIWDEHFKPIRNNFNISKVATDNTDNLNIRGDDLKIGHNSL